MRFKILLVLILLAASVWGQPSGQKKLRLLSLSPHFTRLVIALERTDWLVGVTQYCPPELPATVKRVGTFYDLNEEIIVQLQPQLILAVPTHRSQLHQLQRFIHARILYLSNETIEDVLSSLKTLGEALGREEKATHMSLQLQEELRKWQEKVRKLPRRPRVLCVAGRQPQRLSNIFVAGKETFLTQLIELAGGQNAITQSTPRYPIIGAEKIITLNPEVIIDCSLPAGTTQEAKEAARTLWHSLSPVTAVKQDRIYFITDPEFTIPDHQFGKKVEQLFKILHPTSASENREGKTSSVDTDFH